MGTSLEAILIHGYFGRECVFCDVSRLCSPCFCQSCDGSSDLNCTKWTAYGIRLNSFRLCCRLRAAGASRRRRADPACCPALAIRREYCSLNVVETTWIGVLLIAGHRSRLREDAPINSAVCEVEYV
eukprot:6076126-Pleurochrysis_carterae.AAC.4